MDRVQTFVLHDKIIEKIQRMKEDYGYEASQLFNMGIQLFDYFLKMKEEGWQVGAWQMEEDEKGIVLKKMSFPHERDFKDAVNSGLEMEYVDEQLFDDDEDEHDDDDEEEDWLNIKWKE